MSADLNPSIVEQLAGEANRVYLPTRVKPVTSAAAAEKYSSRPEVQAVAAEYYDDPDRFHGDSVPETTILTEKPIHRSMILLHAQGMSAEEIANNTGYKKPYVQQILRQPWARLRLAQFMKEAGIDAVQHFLKHEVSPSLEVLREIRDNAKRDSDRAAAANSILDRALGKPTQNIKSDNTNRTVPADVSRLDAEIAQVREQLANKGFEDASVPIKN